MLIARKEDPGVFRADVLCPELPELVRDEAFNTH